MLELPGFVDFLCSTMSREVLALDDSLQTVDCDNNIIIVAQCDTCQPQAPYNKGISGSLESTPHFPGINFSLLDDTMCSMQLTVFHWKLM